MSRRPIGYVKSFEVRPEDGEDLLRGAQPFVRTRMHDERVCVTVDIVFYDRFSAAAFAQRLRSLIEEDAIDVDRRVLSSGD